MDNLLNLELLWLAPVTEEGVHVRDAWLPFQKFRRWG
jgi:hypothetical protein